MKVFFEKSDNDKLISKLGFGTWGLGGEAYGEISYNHAVEVVRHAYNSGIRFFDTAPLYGSGRSESILGHALELFNPESFQIVTKIGLYFDSSSGQEFHNFSEAQIRDSIQDSKNRLQREKLDLILFHSPEETHFPMIFQYLQKNYRENATHLTGKFGVSLKKPTDVDFFISTSAVSAFEFNLSLMDQRAYQTTLNTTKLAGFLRIGRTPYNFGFLTDNPPGGKPPSKETNQHLSRWSQIQFDKWHRFREIWLSIADENNLKLQDLALSFVLSSDLVDVVIPGFMDFEQIDSAISTVRRGRLSTETIHKLRQIYLRENSFHSLQSK